MPSGNRKVKNKIIRKAEAKVGACVKRNEANPDEKGGARACWTIYELIASRNLATRSFIRNISFQIAEFKFSVVRKPLLMTVDKLSGLKTNVRLSHYPLPPSPPPLFPSIHFRSLQSKVLMERSG